nr:hypothetical protein CPGR_04569 [Mycolicibacterium malmesburyense]
MFRGVYAAEGGELTLRQRAIAAWLATRRKGVIAGQTAAALHGASWVDLTQPIEIAGASRGAQEGLVLRTESIAEDEITCIAGLPVTTRVRTAYDVGRHLDRGDALARLDALMWDKPFSVDAVSELARRYPRAPGSRQLRELLSLVDGGAATPKESRLRLALVDAGCPRPQTQVPVLVAAQPVGYLDIGWPEYRVAVVCGAEDAAQQRMLESLGWLVVWVDDAERTAGWLARVEAALARRGCFVETSAAA